MKKYILNIAGVGMMMMAIYVWADPASLSARFYPFKELLPEDTTKPKRGRQPTYVPQDRPGDPYGSPPSRSPIQLQDPPGVQNSISLDSSGTGYEINENIGGVEYRPPSSITWDEYVKMRQRDMIRNYWQNKNAGAGEVEAAPGYKPFVIAPIKGDPNAVEIRPTGFVTLDFGGKFQRVQNPTLPLRQQRTGMFVFDQQINMNVVGKIADRLKLTVNWDTKATFEFQNNIKVEFNGKEEDIIKKIDIGVVNFPLPTTLISGSQNLFGVKTKMQFGRLTVSSTIATQRGKTEEITLQGGAQAKTFEVRSSNYEEYKHFFLSHFNRGIYEPSMESLPFINSQVQVKRIEVYVTNRTSQTSGLRSIVAYTDLAETNEYLLRPGQFGIPGTEGKPADNDINTLYSTVSTPAYLDPNTLPTMLDGQNLVRGTDYEIVKSARKLGPNDFIFNAELGYISLNTEIKRDEVLAVAYEYTYKGQSYKVGELTEDYQGRNDSSVVVLKLLKPSSVKTRLPTWDLMMKNIYNLGSTQLQRDMFQLRIIYRDDLSGADLPNLQEGAATKDIPLLRIMGLDRLNPNNDPSPDGNFDFIEGTTINTQNGRVIFPVLEPFGSHLEDKFNSGTEANLIRKYVFFELYDSTKSDAQQIAAKDKFFLKGRYQSGSGSEIVLPGINIAPGSVTVTAGSTVLHEGTDYTIDYTMGRLKIINEGILASGQEIKVRFEKQDLFNFRRKNFYGTRFDFKVNKDFNIGATIVHQNEAPNFTRVNIGDEPSSNTMLGADVQFKKDSRFTTRMLDKLPLLSTKAISNYTFSGEYAALLPGYNKIIDKNDPDAKGTAYIDDFEAVKTPYDFARTPTKWKISTTPQRFLPESNSNDLDTYYRRANMAWYNIDNTFYRTNSGLPDYIAPDSITNHYVRQVLPQEIFPNLQRQQVQTNQIIFDVAYYPTERGPYNYNPAVTTNNGLLPNPTNNWGGIMREIRTDIDFDNANIQYIEFWMMSPYITSAKGNTDIEGAPFDLNNKGKLYFNLGSVSEDVMHNERQDFENGLPADGSELNTARTPWGVTTTQQFITAAFSSDSEARPFQDVGLDGVNNEKERVIFTNFVNAVNVSPLSQAQKDALLADPSADDFGYFLGDNLDNSRADILTRYKKFYGMENNSPINTGGGVTPSSTTIPDNEDLNQNNTVDALDEYYEYEVDIDPTQFIVGENYIVGQQNNIINGESVTWYQFRIPVRMPDNVVGAISGFKTIKFMRMYMTGFAKPVVLRFGQLQLVASQWRVYQPDDINTTGTSVGGEPDDAVIDVSTVNIEENGQGSPTSTPYVLPPGFIRDQDVTTTINRQINEQSLRLCVTSLDDGNARAAYKNVTVDMLNYGRIKAFIHAETADNTILTDGNATAFLRLGTDPTQNYYEIEVPLYFTNPLSSSDPNQVWRSENWIDIGITDLTGVKIARNNAGASMTTAYTMVINGKNITVVGNPDLSTVMVLMLGLRNPRDNNAPHSFCIWMDEFRLTDFNSQAGQAVTANLNMRLADFANINATTRYSGVGFGSIDQKISQRQRNQTLDWGLSGNISLDKLMPQKWGVKLPLYMGINRKIISPQYDPLNPDVELSTSVNSLDPSERSDYRRLVTDQTTQKSINFTNIQKVKTNPTAKAHLYDISNLTLSLGYQETHKSSAILHKYLYQYYSSALGYTFSGGAKSYEPFKNSKGLDKKYLKVFKDINIGYMPTSLTAQFKLDRKITRTEWYESNPLSPIQDPLFEKSYTMNRNFGMVYAFSKNLTIDFRANAYAVIDEPLGEPGSSEYKDSVRSNLLKGGRLKNADQMIGLSYKLPFDKIPITDWIQADARYTAGYTWTASALGIQDTMGNVISNTSERTLNGRLSMDKLYNKSKYLRAINAPPLPKGSKPPVAAPIPPPQKPTLAAPKPDTLSTAKDTLRFNKALQRDTARWRRELQKYSRDSAEYQKQKKDTIPPADNKALKFALRTMMMLKNFNISYSMNTGTSLQGYMRTPSFMGLSSFDDFGNGWLPFILGSQNPDIRHTASDNGWISRSRSLNAPFLQTKVYSLTGKATLEPFREVRIQVDMKTTWTNNYNEIYRMDSIGGTGGYVSNNPNRNGNFSVSYITLLTTFKGAQTFDLFLANLDALKQQLGTAYDIQSQQVMIPSFLAAYSGSAVNTAKPVSLPRIPLPNWRIDYTGLGKIPSLKTRFQSITVSHAYSSMYGIGSFISSLQYGPGAIQPNSSIYGLNGTPTSGVVFGPTGLPVPTYIMDGATIRESFSPLIGVNARSKGNASYKIEWTRNRNIGLQLNNGQITEDVSSGLVLGYGYTKRNMPIPKLFTRGQKRTFKGDITARLDFTIRDQRIVQRRLDKTVTTTAGNINFQFKPTITYAFNARVSAMFYFERSVNTPRISTSYKRSVTNFGVQIRFSLS